VKHGKALTPDTDLTAPQPPLDYYAPPSPESRVIRPLSDDDRLALIEATLVTILRAQVTLLEYQGEIAEAIAWHSGDA